MAVMPQEVKELFEKVPAVAFATATADGQPNASIVGMKWVIDDETIYLSDQFFKKTHANVLANAKVAVAFWEGHDAYQIHGTARIAEGAELEEQKAKADAKFAQIGMPIKAKGGVFVHVDAVYTSAAGPTAGDQIA
ncbi:MULTISPECIES: pyridoxamine 5'-phosphate oxidase family protein [unclassified Adlercreutzia]|uniref:pyridoxamine 5'-phosphate oxidase family protein n=1 Tax=unclassified Adlercreutzia TaxID=2636013 RepID=UPI0013EC4797|nr:MULTISPECIES: pyridoxamine 5'-phosphate oxidase family protein [unclassified Adlercreutzia]